MLNERPTWQKVCGTIGSYLAIGGVMLMFLFLGFFAVHSIWTGFGNSALLAETADLGQITGAGVVLGLSMLFPGWLLWIIGVDQ